MAKWREPEACPAAASICVLSPTHCSGTKELCVRRGGYHRLGWAGDEVAVWWASVRVTGSPRSALGLRGLLAQPTPSAHHPPFRLPGPQMVLPSSLTPLLELPLQVAAFSLESRALLSSWMTVPCSPKEETVPIFSTPHPHVTFISLIVACNSDSSPQQVRGKATKQGSRTSLRPLFLNICFLDWT